MPEDNGIKNLTILYSENAKVAATFWEWRHKVMTRFFAVIAASVVMASWFYQRDELKSWIVFPFFLAALFSLVSDVMDRVNTKILRECYRLGAAMEQEISGEAGIFKSIQDIHYSKNSYHKVLRVMYIGTAFVFGAATIFAAFFMR